MIVPLVAAREPMRIGPRLGDGLLQRRGGVHAGDAAGRGGRAGRQAAGHQGVRHRHGRADAGPRPRRASTPAASRRRSRPSGWRGSSTKDDAVYRVRQELRERVVFAPQNVLQDPPFSRLDIATCRNLLIYLEPEVQQRVLGLLHFGLREGGALFLGTQRDGRRGRRAVRAGRQESADLPAGRPDPARVGSTSRCRTRLRTQPAAARGNGNGGSRAGRASARRAAAVGRAAAPSARCSRYTRPAGRHGRPRSPHRYLPRRHPARSSSSRRASRRAT